MSAFLAANLPYLIAIVCLVLFLLTFIFYLTARQKARRVATVASQDTDEFLHAVFNTAPQAILVTDSSGRILENNLAFQRLTGYSGQELENQNIADIAPAFNLENILQRDLSAPGSQQADIILKSGGRQPYIFFATPFNFNYRTFLLINVRKPDELNAVEENTRRAMDVIQTRMDELSTIRRVTESLNQATTLRGALAPVFENIRYITKSQKLWLFLPERTGKTWLRIDYDPLNTDDSINTTLIKEFEPVCVSLLVSGKLVHARVIQKCDCLPGVEQTTPVANHHALPLYIGKKPIGVLNFIEDDRHPITENRIELLHTICNSLSIAIERVRLFKTEHDQRKLAEMMRDIGTNLTKSLDLSEVFDLLLVQLSRLIPYDGGNVILVNENTAHVERTCGYAGLPEDALSSLKSIKFNVETTHNMRLMIDERRTVIIKDTRKDVHWVPTEPSGHYHSWIGTPVIIDDRVEAFFALDKTEPDFYTSEHAELLTSFASQAALAIKNARLYSRELRRIRELDGLQATLSGINTTLDLNNLLEEIVKRAIGLLDATLGELGLFDPETNSLRIVVSENLDQNYIGNIIKLGEGLMGRVALTREPLAIADYKHWEGMMEQYKDLVPHAGLAVPMLAGDELIGVVGVGDKLFDRQFTQEDIRLLESFAQQAIIAIQNARLFQDAKMRAEQAEKLTRAGAAVASTLNRDEAINRILEQLAFVVPYDSATVLLHEGEKLVIVGGVGFKEITPVLGMDYQLDSKNPGARVFLNNQPEIISDLALDNPNFYQIPQSERPIRSWLGVPLTFKGKPIGILSLDAHETNKFNDEHARLVNAFAGQVSIALENARLYTEEVESANRFKILYELSQVISANLNLEDMYPAIFQAVSRLMRTEFFSIALVDRENALIRDVFMVDREQPVELGFRGIEEGLFAKVIKEGKPRIYNSFDETALSDTGAVLIGDMEEDEISQSLLIVPLKTSKGTLGVLSAQSYTPDMYNGEDLETLELLAANVAIAIENAQLFDKVQSMAVTDPLTGLSNRRKFYENASSEFDISRRYNRPLSVIMLDIDHFKRVNDTYGHAVGDQVLQGLAQLVKSNLRQVDLLARYGGEEFVILMPETGLEEAMLIAERLRENAAEATLPTRAGNMVITISLGVVKLEDDCRNLEELLDRSDQAMYVSKRTGRNKVTSWKPEHSARLPGTGPLPTIKPNQYI